MLILSAALLVVAIADAAPPSPQARQLILRAPENGLSRRLERRLVMEFRAPGHAGPEWQLLPASATRNQIRPDALLVIVHGRCELPAPGAPLHNTPLGWVERQDGALLPFAHVDCNRIGEALARAAAQDKTLDVSTAPVFAHGIAIVIRHELRHLLEPGRAHDRAGDFAASISGQRLMDLEPAGQ